MAEVADARKTLETEADAQREEIRKNWGNGDLESILRIAVDWAGKRTASKITMDRKLVKLFTDISITDMQKYSLLGGPNSAACKAANSPAPYHVMGVLKGPARPVQCLGL
jgi:hypothetical protein